LQVIYRKFINVPYLPSTREKCYICKKTMVKQKTDVSSTNWKGGGIELPDCHATLKRKNANQKP